MSVADGLNGLAYEDDAQVARGVVVKRWAAPQEAEHTRIRVAVFSEEKAAA